MKKIKRGRLLIATLGLLMFPNAFADRIKDIAVVEGVRDTQLIGYGIVVGLKGTGDNSVIVTDAYMKDILKKMGILTDSNKRLKSKNIASVMVTSKLPPFARVGQKIDITVSSMGNAKSIKGGTLLMTPLRAVDGRVYAFGQGRLLSGGLGKDSKADGSKISVSNTSVGYIPGGGSVERELVFRIGKKGRVKLLLNQPDFTTAKRMTKKINKFFGGGVAEALDSSAVLVKVPKNRDQMVSYLSTLLNLEVLPGEQPSKIIINSRTGTVVIGNNVKVFPAAVSHGSLKVKISSKKKYIVNRVTGEKEEIKDSTSLKARDNAKSFIFEEGVSLREIVDGLNDIGASPSDIAAILESLKNVGALRAEIIVI